MTLRHYAFGNVGRDKSDSRSSKHLDLDALRALRAKVNDEHSAVILCEINEGDDNNEMAAIEQVFPKWKLYGRTTREPILLSPDQPKAQSVVYWIPNSSVAHWSPRRSVLVVRLADERTAIVTSHPAAGANGQGDRPKTARGPLQSSWNRTIDKRNQVKLNLHERGWNVVEMMDGNAYDLETLPLLKGEKVVFHDATDWGRVLPAKTHRAEFRKGAVVNFDIDSHDGHVMHGTFKEK